MESFLINRKQIDLRKNKEFTFKIPISLKAFECEFQIETSKEKLSESVSITFLLKNVRETEKNFNFSVDVSEGITKIDVSNCGVEQHADYLLLSCIANKDLSIAFSIIKNQSRFSI